jgi:hypothetical protein
MATAVVSCCFTTGRCSADLTIAGSAGGLDRWRSSGRTNVCNAFEGSSEFITLVATLYGTTASDNERRVTAIETTCRSTC